MQESILLKDLKFVVFAEEEATAFLNAELEFWHAIEEQGRDSEQTWIHLKKLVHLLNKAGLDLLKEQNHILAEQYLLKAKQLLEPQQLIRRKRKKQGHKHMDQEEGEDQESGSADQSPTDFNQDQDNQELISSVVSWQRRSDYQKIKNSVSINLYFIYQSAGNPQEALALLKHSLQENEINMQHTLKNQQKKLMMQCQQHLQDGTKRVEVSDRKGEPVNYRMCEQAGYSKGEEAGYSKGEEAGFSKGDEVDGSKIQNSVPGGSKVGYNVSTYQQQQQQDIYTTSQTWLMDLNLENLYFYMAETLYRFGDGKGARDNALQAIHIAEVACEAWRQQKAKLQSGPPQQQSDFEKKRFLIKMQCLALLSKLAKHQKLLGEQLRCMKQALEIATIQLGDSNWMTQKYIQKIAKIQKAIAFTQTSQQQQQQLIQGKSSGKSSASLKHINSQKRFETQREALQDYEQLPKSMQNIFFKNSDRVHSNNQVNPQQLHSSTSAQLSTMVSNTSKVVPSSYLNIYMHKPHQSDSFRTSPEFLKLIGQSFIKTQQQGSGSGSGRGSMQSGTKQNRPEGNMYAEYISQSEEGKGVEGGGRFLGRNVQCHTKNVSDSRIKVVFGNITKEEEEENVENSDIKQKEGQDKLPYSPSKSTHQLRHSEDYFTGQYGLHPSNNMQQQKNKFINEYGKKRPQSSYFKLDNSEKDIFIMKSHVPSASTTTSYQQQQQQFSGFARINADGGQSISFSNSSQGQLAKPGSGRTLRPSSSNLHQNLIKQRHLKQSANPEKCCSKCALSNSQQLQKQQNNLLFIAESIQPKDSIRRGVGDSDACHCKCHQNGKQGITHGWKQSGDQQHQESSQFFFLMPKSMHKMHSGSNATTTSASSYSAKNQMNFLIGSSSSYMTAAAAQMSTNSLFSINQGKKKKSKLHQYSQSISQLELIQQAKAELSSIKDVFPVQQQSSQKLNVAGNAGTSGIKPTPKFNSCHINFQPQQSQDCKVKMDIACMMMSKRPPSAQISQSNPYQFEKPPPQQQQQPHMTTETGNNPASATIQVQPQQSQIQQSQQLTISQAQILTPDKKNQVGMDPNKPNIIAFSNSKKRLTLDYIQQQHLSQMHHQQSGKLKAVGNKRNSEPGINLFSKAVEKILLINKNGQGQEFRQVVNRGGSITGIGGKALTEGNINNGNNNAANSGPGNNNSNERINSAGEGTARAANTVETLPRNRLNTHDTITNNNNRRHSGFSNVSFPENSVNTNTLAEPSSMSNQQQTAAALIQNAWHRSHKYRKYIERQLQAKVDQLNQQQITSNAQQPGQQEKKRKSSQIDPPVQAQVTVLTQESFDRSRQNSYQVERQGIQQQWLQTGSNNSSHKDGINLSQQSNANLVKRSSFQQQQQQQGLFDGSSVQQQQQQHIQTPKNLFISVTAVDQALSPLEIVAAPNRRRVFQGDNSEFISLPNSQAGGFNNNNNAITLMGRSTLSFYKSLFIGHPVLWTVTQLSPSYYGGGSDEKQQLNRTSSSAYRLPPAPSSNKRKITQLKYTLHLRLQLLGGLTSLLVFNVQCPIASQFNYCEAILQQKSQLELAQLIISEWLDEHGLLIWKQLAEEEEAYQSVYSGVFFAYEMKKSGSGNGFQAQLSSDLTPQTQGMSSSQLSPQLQQQQLQLQAIYRSLMFILSKLAYLKLKLTGRVLALPNMKELLNYQYLTVVRKKEMIKDFNLFVKLRKQVIRTIASQMEPLAFYAFQEDVENTTPELQQHQQQQQKQQTFTFKRTETIEQGSSGGGQGIDRVSLISNFMEDSALLVGAAQSKPSISPSKELQQQQLQKQCSQPISRLLSQSSMTKIAVSQRQHRYNQQLQLYQHCQNSCQKTQSKQRSQKGKKKQQPENNQPNYPISTKLTGLHVVREKFEQELEGAQIDSESSDECQQEQEIQEKRLSATAVQLDEEASTKRKIEKRMKFYSLKLIRDRIIEFGQALDHDYNLFSPIHRATFCKKSAFLKLVIEKIQERQYNDMDMILPFQTELEKALQRPRSIFYRLYAVTSLSSREANHSKRLQDQASLYSYSQQGVGKRIASSFSSSSSYTNFGGASGQHQQGGGKYSVAIVPERQLISPLSPKPHQLQLLVSQGIPESNNATGKSSKINASAHHQHSKNNSNPLVIEQIQEEKFRNKNISLSIPIHSQQQQQQQYAISSESNRSIGLGGVSDRKMDHDQKAASKCSLEEGDEEVQNNQIQQQNSSNQLDLASSSISLEYKQKRSGTGSPSPAKAPATVTSTSKYGNAEPKKVVSDILQIPLSELQSVGKQNYSVQSKKVSASNKNESPLQQQTQHPLHQADPTLHFESFALLKQQRQPVPENFSNPFHQEQEMLMQGLTRLQKRFFFVQIYFCHDQPCSDTVYLQIARRHAFFELELTQVLQMSPWHGRLRIPFQKFITFFLQEPFSFSHVAQAMEEFCTNIREDCQSNNNSNTNPLGDTTSSTKSIKYKISRQGKPLHMDQASFNYQKFLILRGFTQQQKARIIANLNYLIKIENSTLQVKYYFFKDCLSLSDKLIRQSNKTLKQMEEEVSNINIKLLNSTIRQEHRVDQYVNKNRAISQVLLQIGEQNRNLTNNVDWQVAEQQYIALQSQFKLKHLRRKLISLYQLHKQQGLRLTLSPELQKFIDRVEYKECISQPIVITETGDQLQLHYIRCIPFVNPIKSDVLRQIGLQKLELYNTYESVKQKENVFFCTMLPYDRFCVYHIKVEISIIIYPQRQLQVRQLGISISCPWRRISHGYFETQDKYVVEKWVNIINRRNRQQLLHPDHQWDISYQDVPNLQESKSPKDSLTSNENFTFNQIYQKMEKDSWHIESFLKRFSRKRAILFVNQISGKRIVSVPLFPQDTISTHTPSANKSAYYNEIRKAIFRSQTQGQQGSTTISTTAGNHDGSGSAFEASGLKGLSDFIYTMKLILMCYNVEALYDVEKNEIITKYFNVEEARCVQRIRQIGNAFTSFVVFKTKCSPYLVPLAYMRLDITPLRASRQRIEKHKFLFSIADLNSLFDSTYTYDNCLDKLQIVQVGHRILSALSYEKASAMYKQFLLPMSLVNTEKIDLHCYTLYNQFTMKPVYEGRVLSQYLSDSTLLTPVVREVKVIGQFTKKIVEHFNKKIIVSYIIFTVKYYRRLDFYGIEIYVPKTGRRFTCIFYQQYLKTFTPEFMNEIFRSKEFISLVNRDQSPTPLDIHREDDSAKGNLFHVLDNSKQNQFSRNFLDYLDFTNNFNRYQYTKTAFGSNKQQTNAEDSNKKNPQNEKLLQIAFYKQNPDKFINLFQQFNKSYETGFFEIKIWEKMIEKSRIEVNQFCKLTLYLDSFQGLLREYLVLRVINMYQKENALCEIFLEAPQYMTSVQHKQETIRLVEAKQYNLLVRLTRIEKVNQFSEKLDLPKLLAKHQRACPHLLQNYQKKQYFSTPSQYEFIQADLAKMANFLIGKIKHHYVDFQKLKKSADASASTLAQRKSCIDIALDLVLMEEKTEEIMKVNSNLNLNTLLEKNKVGYLLIFRHIFTIKPLQMMAILFRPESGKFFIIVYNVKNSKQALTTLTLQQIQTYIPYIQQMIELRCYLQIGSRIFKAFKNQLMIQCFYLLNEEDVKTSSSKLHVSKKQNMY